MGNQVSQRRNECHSRGPRNQKCEHDHASHFRSVDEDGNEVRGDCLCSGCSCREFVSREEAEADEKRRKLAGAAPRAYP